MKWIEGILDGQFEEEYTAQALEALGRKPKQPEELDGSPYMAPDFMNESDIGN